MKNIISLIVFFGIAMTVCLNSWAEEKKQEPKKEIWVLEVKSNCKAMAEGYKFEDHEAFNDWYDNVHIPDVMKAMPEFKSARRYVNPDYSTIDTGKYLAFYEIETDDIGKTMANLLKTVRDIVEAGRMSPLLETVSMSVYKQTSSFVRDK